MKSENLPTDRAPIAALSGDQACIVVTHWEEEVPWGKADGIKKYVLQDGRGQVV